MYSYIKDDGKGGKTAKGVIKSVTRKNIKHDNYKNVLLFGKQLSHTMKTIRSHNHQLGSYKINKVSLSCFDDKCNWSQVCVQAIYLAGFRIWRAFLCYGRVNTIDWQPFVVANEQLFLYVI